MAKEIGEQNYQISVNQFAEDWFTLAQKSNFVSGTQDKILNEQEVVDELTNYEKWFPLSWLRWFIPWGLRQLSKVLIFGFFLPQPKYQDILIKRDWLAKCDLGKLAITNLSWEMPSAFMIEQLQQLAKHEPVSSDIDGSLLLPKGRIKIWPSNLRNMVRKVSGWISQFITFFTVKNKPSHMEIIKIVRKQEVEQNVVPPPYSSILVKIDANGSLVSYGTSISMADTVAFNSINSPSQYANYCQCTAYLLGVVNSLLATERGSKLKNSLSLNELVRSDFDEIQNGLIKYKESHLTQVESDEIDTTNQLAIMNASTEIDELIELCKKLKQLYPSRTWEQSALMKQEINICHQQGIQMARLLSISKRLVELSQKSSEQVRKVSEQVRKVSEQGRKVSEQGRKVSEQVSKVTAQIDKVEALRAELKVEASESAARTEVAKARLAKLKLENEQLPARLIRIPQGAVKTPAILQYDMVRDVERYRVAGGVSTP